MTLRSFTYAALHYRDAYSDQYLFLSTPITKNVQGNTKRGRLAQLLRWCDQRHGLKDQGGKSDCWVRLLPILTTKSLQAKDLRLNRVFRCARFGCESDGLTSGMGSSSSIISTEGPNWQKNSASFLFGRMANRYSDQPGLEVVDSPLPPPPDKLFQQLQHPSNDPAHSSPIPVASLGGNYPGSPQPPPPPPTEHYAQQGYAAGGGHPQFNGGPPAPEREDRICGLKRWVFFVLILAAVVVVAAAVGGGVGGALAGKNNNNNSAGQDNGGTATTTDTTTSAGPTSTTSAPPRLPTPGTFAAVKSSDPNQENYNSLTYLFQDVDTPDIWMWTIIRGQDWIQIGKLEGLDPPPRLNSSIAAVQAPDGDTISLFYTAENGTLYDAIGSPQGTRWRMGTLAPLTNYGVLVSEGSGMGASWWGNKDDNGPGYRIRIYYVDRAAARVRELAYDANKTPRWFITDQQLETCSPQAKVTIAHLPPENSTSTRQETAHLFYEGRNGNLRHFPGYDGTWDSSYAETIPQSSIPSGAYITASIYVNEASNHTIRLWYLDASGRLSVISGLGQSKKAFPDFDNLGTFDTRAIVSSSTTNYISLGQVEGGSIAVVGWVEGGEQVRIYYQANIRGNGGKNGAVEIAGTNGWQSKVLEIEEL
ncbi:uncharacterized protein DFL_006488 [Arthrobotrys flagrans]|uniref:Fucose-specific lectin n=1 Tax=Arthrobotrys flagrans TaxID=97331 RepID=A0A437A145_ARTFL|nr:hypothetical protein DFL_006488 [Arthrobotrys flagrans]